MVLLQGLGQIVVGVTSESVTNAVVKYGVVSIALINAVVDVFATRVDVAGLYDGTYHGSTSYSIFIGGSLHSMFWDPLRRASSGHEVTVVSSKHLNRFAKRVITHTKPRCYEDDGKHLGKPRDIRSSDLLFA